MSTAVFLICFMKQRQPDNVQYSIIQAEGGASAASHAAFVALSAVPPVFLPGAAENAQAEGSAASYSSSTKRLLLDLLSHYDCVLRRHRPVATASLQVLLIVCAIRHLWRASVSPAYVLPNILLWLKVGIIRR